jgi:hypothetical protein
VSVMIEFLKGDCGAIVVKVKQFHNIYGGIL